MKKTILGLLFSVLILAGCSDAPDANNTTKEIDKPKVGDIAPDGTAITEIASSYELHRSSDEVDRTPGIFTQKPEPSDDEEVAVIHTPQGTMYVRFFADEAPKSVENFKTHAKNGYYDKTVFHRVIKGFMIQGGDPLGNGTGGQSIWGGSFEDEFSANVKNNKGSLAMANSGPNTNGSQFFINQVDNNFLDGKHTVFGEVFRGQKTIDSIAKVKASSADKPLKSMHISVTIVPYKLVK